MKDSRKSAGALLMDDRSLVRSGNGTTFKRLNGVDGVELVSASYRSREFPIHTHDCYVLGTVTQGAEELRVRGQGHVIKAGDGLLLHPNEPHANRSIGESPLSYRVFYLSAAAIEQHWPGFRPGLSMSPVIANAEIACRLAAIHARLFAGHSCSLELQTAILAIAEMIAAHSGSDSRSVGKPSSAAIRVRDWIDEHYSENFGLVELAGIADLSLYRTAHLFKSVIGVSPIAYRNQCRVYAARRLLRSEQPIAEIALEVGFADQSHLTRQFQRLMGVSPNSYRQQ
jgi:AraC-like DNA-binding protein